MRLPASLAVRIGGVAAAAAVALTGATAVANAATTPAVAHHHRIPTTLSISNSAPVASGTQTTAVITGHLKAGTYNLRHLRVWLERLGSHGKWHLDKTALTGRHGHVAFRVHAGKKAAIFRLVFRGTRNFARSVSKVDTISPVSTS